LKLRQIKLAGFKTFVDPTTISLPGQLVGIVGPNGCGKSNIMESVKWVLGSSSAKEMRGESMESVIFNGTDTRPAISRASVELLFDNSENKVANEWSQYAEISVRRLIEKDKGSTYSINGTTVRRKDVADLYYGTGLGSRGYAIIGQNTISQLVEAKPEDLKSFLEEAAGISKYKERRKETEYRLRDTRDNLQRIKDLEKEINSAITKLEAQAEAAKKYDAFQEDLKLLKARFAYVKKESASQEWQNAQAKLKQIEINLEQKKAELTKAEINVDQDREAFKVQSESINPIQAKFYEVSSKVSSTESKIESNNNEAVRVKSLITQSNERLSTIENERQRLSELLVSHDQELQKNQKNLDNFDQTLVGKKEKYVSANEKFDTVNNKYSACEKELQNLKEQLNLDENTLNFINNKLTDFTNRLEALKNELVEQNTKASDAEKDVNPELNSHKKSIDELTNNISSKRLEFMNDESELEDLIQRSQNLQVKKGGMQAEIKSLQNLINSQYNQDLTDKWLKKIGIEPEKGLLKQLRVDKKYSLALDSVLGLKSNAYLTNKSTQEKPPYALTMLYKSNEIIKQQDKGILKSLMQFIDINNEFKASLTEFLYGVFVLEDISKIDDQIQLLSTGEIIVDLNGNLYGKNFRCLVGEKNITVDVFATKTKIEELQKNYDICHSEFNKVVEQSSSIKNKIESLKEILDELTEKKDNSVKLFNELEIKNAQQRHQLTSSKEQILKITDEIEKLLLEQKKINDEKKQKLQNCKNNESKILELGVSISKVKEDKDLLNKALDEAREVFNGAEKQKQEAEYQVALINNKISDINERMQLLNNEFMSLSKSSKEYNLENFANKEKNLQEELSDVILEKDNLENQLKLKRDELAVYENKLRASEQTQLGLNQEINPLSENQQTEKLKEQQTKIDFDYALKEFNQYQIDEDIILKDALNDKPDLLIEKIESLSQKIERIGPINMAAVSELDSEKERIKYITEQVLDLTSASDALESAIGKIDRETREKLKETYNQVNLNLNDYFRKLFGGGRAVLELLGNEILDTGLQIVAQPPGKKNTTIHLLSGGEKALTAIALVFSLFRLNPAPFCLLDEVDAPLDDSNTERFCDLVNEMSGQTQFLYVSHNKITMEMAQQLIGVTMQESGVSRIVEVDLNDARKLQEVTE
jgi:chromosome segregation protein